MVASLDFLSFRSTVQLAPTFPSMFGVSWPLGSREEVQNIFKMAAMVAILDFRSKWFKLFLIYKSQFLPTKFLWKSIGLSVLEKKQKINLQEGGNSGHLGFQIGMILATFDLQVTPMLPSFKLTGHMVQEKKWKINFQDSRHNGHLGFKIRMILAIFDLQVNQNSSQLAFQFRRRSKK